MPRIAPTFEVRLINIILDVIIENSAKVVSQGDL